MGKAVKSDCALSGPSSKFFRKIKKSENSRARLIRFSGAVAHEDVAGFSVDVGAHVLPALMAQALFDQFAIEGNPIFLVLRKSSKLRGDKIRRSREQNCFGRIESLRVKGKRVEGKLSRGFAGIGEDQLIGAVSRCAEIPASIESNYNIVRIDLAGIGWLYRTIADDSDRRRMTKARNVSEEFAFADSPSVLDNQSACSFRGLQIRNRGTSRDKSARGQNCGEVPFLYWDRVTATGAGEMSALTIKMPNIGSEAAMVSSRFDCEGDTAI
jgi:hypothetical protein